jgi:signal peptidase I
VESGDAAQPGAGTGPDAEAGKDAQIGKDGGKPGKQAKKRGSFLRELPILIVIALALALLIKTFLFQAYFIPSGSMQNTLEKGDKVLVNKYIYDLRSIHRGDIIVFNGAGSWNPGPVPAPNIFDRFYHAVIGLFGAAPGQTDYIKRVIGIPGDYVACCNAQGDVTVNGIALHESSYLFPGNPPSEIRFNITVPPGRLWVMGDHRDISDDSRLHTNDRGGGTIPENEVVGRAGWIVWPPSRWRVLPIPATFEQPALNAHHTTAAARPGASEARLLSASSLLSVPVVPAGPTVPLAAGFAGALPLTWGQRRLRHRIRRRLSRRPRTKILPRLT